MSKVALVVALLCACGPKPDSARLDGLERQQRDHDLDLAGAEDAARRLSQDWAAVARSYHDARGRYDAARRAFEDARARYDRASTEFQRASETWQDAERWWNHARRLLVLAAAIDAHNLDNYRGWRRSSNHETFSCARVGTAAFRRKLIAEGWNLAGKHVDHIVPRSLGGADHPMNYQVLDAHTNISLGNKWDKEKCGMVGRRCADAIAVSKKCGSYNGPWF